MNATIPFLRPSLPLVDTYLPSLRSIDASRQYSNYGPLCTAFESRVLAEAFSDEGGFSTVSNATIGLMLSIRQAKRKGRFALMPSFTFAATPLAAEWAGLEPYFIDVDPQTWCMDIDCLGNALDHLGKDVAVVVPYATFGTAMDLEPFAKLCRSGIPVVVDAAASFGTEIDAQQYGKGFPGLLVFSFHATKAFGIGEGGAVYSQDADAIIRLRRAGNFGFGPERTSLDCGLNAKISEYTAAIALSTWEDYPRKMAARRIIQRAYLNGLETRGMLSRGWRPQKLRGLPAFQFMPLLCPEGMTSSNLLPKLESLGIECRTYFNPACHQQPYFQDCKRGEMGVTEHLAQRILSLPLWEDLPLDAIERVLGGLEP